MNAPPDKRETTFTQQCADHVLSVLRLAEKEALRSVWDRLEAVQADSIASWKLFLQHYEKRTAELRGLMDRAKNESEKNADTFRSKLLTGPIAEEEFRARTVMLEMEYDSRLKIAQEGYELINRIFREHCDQEEERIRGMCGRLREALRMGVVVEREKIIAPFIARDRAFRELGDELRRTRDTLQALELCLAGKDEELARLRRAGDDTLAAAAALEQRDLAMGALEEAREAVRRAEARAVDAARAGDERADDLRAEILALEERLSVVRDARDQAQARVRELEASESGRELRDQESLRAAEQAAAQREALEQNLAAARHRAEEAGRSADEQRRRHAERISEVRGEAEKVMAKLYHWKEQREKALAESVQLRAQLARQDAERMKEIFALKKEVERLQGKGA